MAKLLIGVSSCERFEQNGWNDALRETWLGGTDYKFFHGIGATPREDVVVTDIDDSYNGITVKAKRKFQYAVDHGYDFLFHCYHDTYACVERIVALCDGRADYIGDFLHTDYRQPYPHNSYGKHCNSGCGVVLSRAAFSHIAKDTPEAPWPNYTEEDHWAGESVRRHEELKIEDSRWFTTSLSADDPGPRRDNEIVSNHLSTIEAIGYTPDKGRETEFKYRPEYMRKLHQEWLESCR